MDSFDSFGSSGAFGVTGIPNACLDAITTFIVEDFEGVEDLEVLSNTKGECSSVIFSCGFDLLTVLWTVQIPTSAYPANSAAFDENFLDINHGTMGETSMQLVQRCYFEADLVFDQSEEEFGDVEITLTGVHRRRRRSI